MVNVNGNHLRWGYRGNKTIELKEIIDEALEKCPSVEKVLVVKRTNTQL
jgi:acetyl-CoA synthetase